MYSKYFTQSPSNIYAPVWSKYRPAILQLMVAAGEKPQEYKLFKHEFVALNPKEKAGFHFNMTAFQGKPAQGAKINAIAKDLLDVLVNSKKAAELMDKDRYEFELDKQFVFRVRKIVTVVETAPESVAAPATEE